MNSYWNPIIGFGGLILVMAFVALVGRSPLPTAALNAQSVDGQAVAMTEQDVRDWVQERKHPYWDSDSPEPVIESIDLQTATEARELTGGWIDLPDDAPVYVATLSGTFVVVGPRMPNMNNVLVGDTGRIVFDAMTGNVLNYNVDNLERID